MIWASSVKASYEDELVLAVAKVCANEASLRSEAFADCTLIWQTARHREDPLEWLQRHSSCVLGDREAVGNCRWSRHLDLKGTEPEGFDAVWENFRLIWVMMLDHVRALVRGEGRDVCPVDPDTWGGPMDEGRARRAGWVLVLCRGTANSGWLWRRSR